jgi:hypothetical protein
MRVGDGRVDQNNSRWRPISSRLGDARVARACHDHPGRRSRPDTNPPEPACDRHDGSVIVEAS